MNFKDCKDYSKIYFTTAFIVHCRKDVLNKRRTMGGAWFVRESLRALNGVYAFQTGLNTNLEELDTSEERLYYTEADVKSYADNRRAVKAINHMVIQTCTGISSVTASSDHSEAKTSERIDPELVSPFRLQFKANKELIDFLDAVESDSYKPSLELYIHELHRLSKGIIQICIRIEPVTAYLRDMFLEGRSRNIELPAVYKRKFTLEDAITIALTTAKKLENEKLNDYLEQFRVIGAVDKKELLDGIFYQQLQTLLPDDALPTAMLHLGELNFTKQLYTEDLVLAFKHCQKKYNILQDLREHEFVPLAEYIVEEVKAGFANSEDNSQ